MYEVIVFYIYINYLNLRFFFFVGSYVIKNIMIIYIYIEVYVLKIVKIFVKVSNYETNMIMLILNIEYIFK